MSQHPDTRDQEIARQMAKLEPGDCRFICSKCLKIRAESMKCIARSEAEGEPICIPCCVRFDSKIEACGEDGQ